MRHTHTIVDSNSQQALLDPTNPSNICSTEDDWFISSMLIPNKGWMASIITMFQLKLTTWEYFTGYYNKKQNISILSMTYMIILHIEYWTVIKIWLNTSHLAGEKSFMFNNSNIMNTEH